MILGSSSSSNNNNIVQSKNCYLEAAERGNKAYIEVLVVKYSRFLEYL